MNNHKIKIIFLVIFTFLVYSNIYQNQFISDDISGIVTNNNIQNVQMAIQSLSIYSTIRSINFNLGGLDPAMYHFTNIIFHTTNVILIYLLIPMLPLWKKEKNQKIDEKKDWVAFACATIFSVHPIETESVTWISGGGYAMYTTFLLLSLISCSLLVQSVERKGKTIIITYFLPAFFYSLALLTSLKAIFWPVIVILFFVFAENPLEKKWEGLKKYFLTIFSVISVTGVFLIPIVTGYFSRIHALNPFTKINQAVYNPLFEIPTAIFYYIKLMVFPVGLTLYHDFIITNIEILGILAVNLAIILGFFIAFRKKKYLIVFSFLLFFISILPNFSPIKIAWTVAERYVYFGSIGIFTIISYILYEIGQRLKNSDIANFLLIIIIICLVPITFLRNMDWKNEDTMWPATVQVSPYSPIAHNNMGDYYSRRKEYSPAIDEFIKAVNLKGGQYPEALHNLGNTYAKINETTKAAEMYNKALAQKPDLLESYLQLTNLYFMQKENDKAEETIYKALEYYPRYSLFYNYLSYLAIQKNDKNKAIEYLKKAISLDPEIQMYKTNLTILQNQ